MTINATNDSFAAVREAGTSGPNYDLDTDAILAHLTHWQSLCSFTVVEAEREAIDIEFTTLPADIDSFVRELYEFCPDLVDQGTGCIHEMVEAMQEVGEDLDPEIEKLIEGIDFSDENYGLEILKREIVARKSLRLWWD